MGGETFSQPPRNGRLPWENVQSKTAPESVVRATDCVPGPNPRGKSEASMSMTPHPCDSTPGGALPDPTSVYRYYDHRNALIYVGITKQGMGRNLQHNGRAEWWQYVDHQAVEHYPTRQAAAAREKALIRQYLPPFNRQHHSGWEQSRELYLAFAEAPDRRETLLEAYQRTGRSLPLDVHDYRPSSMTLTLRTRLQDNLIASNLHVPDGTRLEGRGRMGLLTSIEEAGSFHLLHFKLRLLRDIESAAASIRWRQSTAAKGEHVELRVVLAETAPVVAR